MVRDVASGCFSLVVFVFVFIKGSVDYYRRGGDAVSWCIPSELLDDMLLG